MKDILNYYNNYEEENRLIRTNAHKVEFLTNIEFLNRAITTKGRLLDVGAGTGIYSFYFAEKGFKVDALDISPKHVDRMNEKANSNKISNITIGQGDALDLSKFCDESFDIVICFGPIYHLRDENNRRKCIEECLRVLKTDGLLAVAYISKYHIAPSFLKNRKMVFNAESSTGLLVEGNINSDVDDFLTIAHFDAPDEIENLVKEYKVNIISHIASEGVAPFISSEINQLSDDDYQHWLHYHFATCNEKSILGISNHGMVIGKKTL